MSATILIVEDDEILGRVLVRVLEGQGFTVVLAASVARALELARDHSPELALIDLCLPDGTGRDLAGKLRAERDGLPLILMTAYPLTASELCKLAGMFDRILSKPLDLRKVREAIDAALAGACRG